MTEDHEKNHLKQQSLMNNLTTILLFVQTLILLFVVVRANNLAQQIEDNHEEQLTLIRAIGASGLIARVEDVEYGQAPMIGNLQADTVIVEFLSYTCIFCKNASPELIELVQGDGNLLIAHRYFVPEGPGSYSFEAAKAALCADEQDEFVTMHNLLFENQDNLDTVNFFGLAENIGLDTDEFEICMNKPKISEQILSDTDYGFQYEVYGTPTFFVNGYKLEGFSSSAIQSLINISRS